MIFAGSSATRSKQKTPVSTEDPAPQRRSTRVPRRTIVEEEEESDLPDPSGVAHLLSVTFPTCPLHNFNMKLQTQATRKELRYWNCWGRTRTLIWSGQRSLEQGVTMRAEGHQKRKRAKERCQIHLDFWIVAAGRIRLQN